MKNLSEALKKSMLNKLEKHDKYYVVWSRFLNKNYNPYIITCDKRDKFYPQLYILPENLTNKFKDENKNTEFIIYRVKPSFGNIQKFKDEYEKGNITMDWEHYNNIDELDIVYDNTEK